MFDYESVHAGIHSTACALLIPSVAEGEITNGDSISISGLLLVAQGA